MLIIGLTGPSGSGKGILASYLRKCGMHVINCDEISRIVCEKGQPCLDELVKSFSDGILLPDGSLNRKKLAEIVFSADKDGIKLKKLNEITHKYILSYLEKLLAESGKSCAAVCVDAPQLFESGLDEKCGYIIGVTANRETRIKRIMKRDNITRESAEKRIQCQLSDSFFASGCDVLFHNDADEKSLIRAAEPYILPLLKGELPEHGDAE